MLHIKIPKNKLKDFKKPIQNVIASDSVLNGTGNNVYLNYTDYNKLTAMFSKTENACIIHLR